MMNRLIPLTLGLTLPLMGMADEINDNRIAGGTIGGKLTFATDYVFRGESETQDGKVPVVQGTLGWTHDNGWYLGAFASNIKFQDPNLEIVTAPYFGKYGEIGNSGFQYDVMLFAYLYPGASYSNYTELWLRVSKAFDDLNLQVEITPTLDDWFGVDGWKGVNYALHPSYQLAANLTVSGSVGYQDLYDADDAAEGWGHWNLGVNTQYIGLDFDLRYHGSTVDKDHKVYGTQTLIFDDRLVFGVSKRF
ncbi:TorF family putative porin [Shewanella sp. GXUN23E]|uniref:TorF family putative porin n=1 Tax=Shewanella sp. GXUN23E TaxID=3422498 RepID=UPI003D7EDEEA